jgi:hypothetical protein
MSRPLVGIGLIIIYCGMPHYPTVDRKSEDGAEVSTMTCGHSNVMLNLEFVKKSVRLWMLNLTYLASVYGIPIHLYVQHQNFQARRRSTERELCGAAVINVDQSMCAASVYHMLTSALQVVRRLTMAGQ